MRMGAKRDADMPLLEVRDLVCTFDGERRGLFAPCSRLQAVSGASFTIARSEVFGLVGESGCGKSTTAKAILNIHRPDAGEVRFDGEDLTSADKARWKQLRQEIQYVFQDPVGALDPRIRILDQIVEPLVIHGLGTRSERVIRARNLMRAVSLGPECEAKYPHELSGGQQQRVVIARALTLEPTLLICDEPVAALDVSVQAQVINLLARLRSEFNLTILFISHDLSLVRHLCDRVAVMYLGRIVEIGASREVFANPQHPYTQALISAIPMPDPSRQQSLPLLGDEPPDPLSPPTGCGFHPRCPHTLALCRSERPSLRPLPGRQDVACHAVLAET